MKSKIIRTIDNAQNSYIALKSRVGLIRGKYKKYTIIKPDSIGKSICVFKPETHEVVKLMRVYGFIEDGEFSLTYPEINVWCFENASVIGRNDFVIINDKVFWGKMYHYNFAKNIPLDKNLITYDDKSVTIKENEPSKKIDVAFSLLGVHATVWSHSLSEYYSKISVLSKVLEQEKGVVKVLVPIYEDKQLKQIIYDALKKFYRIEIVPVQDGTRVLVNRLYYLPRPATFTDNETYVSIGDDVQPKIISDIIKRDLVTPGVKDAKDESYPKKLFLIRRATHRVLTNNDEVEDFFKAQGYFLLDPSKVTLEEKVKYFYNADVLVGPFSSAFSNLIFSKPGTKVLLFSNYQRIFENWLSMHFQHFSIDIWYVTGYDVMKDNSAHTNFYVSLDRIKEACHKVNIELSENLV